MNVRDCTTEVSEESEKRENEQKRQRRKEGMDLCWGGVVQVWVCLGDGGVVAHELHTKAPRCTLPLRLCPACQACRVRVCLRVCVFVFLCSPWRVRACVCKAEVG